MVNSILDVKRANKILSDCSNVEEIIKGFNILDDDVEVNDIEREKYSSECFSMCTAEEQKRFLSYLSCYVYLFVCDRATVHTGSTMTMDEVYRMVIDGRNKNIQKSSRRLIYPTQRSRQSGKEKNWMDWNGFQVIDLDIKNARLTDIIKPLLFGYLKSQRWFIGITRSASGGGIHIWTKIKPRSINHSTRIKEFQLNFRHKFSFVYCCLENIYYYLNSRKEQYNIIDGEISTEKMLTWIDKAMCKITQGAFIPYDKTAELNTNFIDTYIDVKDNSIGWQCNKVLKELFERFNYFTSDDNERDNIDKSMLDFSSSVLVTGIKSKHYKHDKRFRIANTLCKLYGKDAALEILDKMCGAFTSHSELAGYVRTAAGHDKGIDKWAVQELNRVHGFDIKIKTNKTVEALVTGTCGNDGNIKSPSDVFDTGVKTINFFIRSDQYLSDIKSDILASCSNLTLIEAGAGTGKTEMIKRLSGRVLMVLPFTSIIKSKIEYDSLGDNWLTFYGSKIPSPHDFMNGNNMCMTIDKFSRLSVAEIEINKFDYIVIDESHLLFMSSFRDVMQSALQVITNVYKSVPVILFTGTPTGERLFLSGITHIKVKKEDRRTKKVTFYMCHKDEEQTYEMCKHMAELIENGKHILFPTNSGAEKFNKICKIIQHILVERKSHIRLKTFYYKKANSGKYDMDKINRDKSIGNNHIIGCTSFLSVGVDICDNYDFEVFFNELFIPQDIEQFANRIRDNNLYINIYLKKFDSNGSPIDYSVNHGLNLNIDKERVIEFFDYTQLLNSVSRRNGVINTFNPIAKTLERQYNFIKFDPIDNEWYVDKIGYLLNTFEERYRDYFSQLPVVKESMRYYGYVTEVVDICSVLTDDRRERFNELVHDIKSIIVSDETSETFKWLACLSDDSFDLFKNAAKNIEELNSDFFKERCEELGLYLPSNNEIVFKNIPFINTFKKWYDYDVIQEIYESCASKRSSRINYSSLNRIRAFIIFEEHRIRSNVDIPFYKLIKDSYDWFSVNNQISENLFEHKKSELLTPYVNSIDNLCLTGSDTGGDKFFAQKVKDNFDKFFKILFNIRKSHGIVSISPFKPLWSFKENISNMYIDPGIRAILGETLVNNLIEASKKENPIEVSPDKDMANLSDETKNELDAVKFGQGTRIAPDDVTSEYSDGDDYDYNKVAYMSSKIGKAVNWRFIEQQNAIWQTRQNQYKTLQNEVLQIFNDITGDDPGLFNAEEIY